MNGLFHPPLVELIREHNRLNGLRFSIVEFVLVGAVALFLAISGVWHLLIGIGIALNMATVAIVGVWQIRDGERSEGSPWKMFDSRYRQKIAREHPNLSIHTALIVVTSLIPFLLTVLVIVQR
jgi:hypothetical protein